MDIEDTLRILFKANIEYVMSIEYVQNQRNPVGRGNMVGRRNITNAILPLALNARSLVVSILEMYVAFRIGDDKQSMTMSNIKRLRMRNSRFRLFVVHSVLVR